MAFSSTEIVSIAGPVLLAVIGGLVSMIPNIARRRERFYVAALFIVIGGGTAWAAYVEANNMEEEIHGGEVISLTILGATDPSGNYFLTAQNGNRVPVFDVFIKVRPNAGDRIDTAKKFEAMRYYQVDLGTIPVGLKQLPVTLAPGYYQIDIHTRDAVYTEMLRFAPIGNQIGQSRVVADYFGHTFEKITVPDSFPKVY